MRVRAPVGISPTARIAAVQARSEAPSMRKLSPLALALAAGLAVTTAEAAPLVLPDSGGATTLPAGPAAPSVRRGYQALEANDLLAAETAFREGMRLEPSSPAAYIGMSELSARRAVASGAPNWSENPDIESWLRKALEVDPNGVTTLRSWARFLSLRGRFPDAEAALQKAVTAAPTDIGAWLHLSEVQLRGLRNGASAEASARKAIAVNR
ncbi:MAG: tetratricopeptide repeat protein, partial [Alphaproteobacteria bacterium]|nr:tetratricopeptide repeat protein [Alphaproteobacteria bacterium]